MVCKGGGGKGARGGGMEGDCSMIRACDSSLFGANFNKKIFGLEMAK